MRIEKTVPALRQGKRIFRQAWRDAGEDGEVLDILFVSIDKEERFILERESTVAIEDTVSFDMTIEDLLANDWRIEEDAVETTNRVRKLLNFENFSLFPSHAPGGALVPA
jgi:hypothetical protein